MLWLDFRNAIDNSADNFSVKLFRLLLKSDMINFEKLKSIYPVEAAMVFLYQNDCPYVDKNCTEVDYEAIEKIASKVYLQNT